jgi:hypothetical protein
MLDANRFLFLMANSEGGKVYGRSYDPRRSGDREKQAVWAALSDLWLETEFTEDDHQRIAGIMKRSGYSVNELRDINLFEVATVVFHNLLSVAGEWAGFNEEWLFAEATKWAKKRSVILRALIRLGIGQVDHDIGNRAALRETCRIPGHGDLTSVGVSGETASDLNLRGSRWTRLSGLTLAAVL